MGALNVYALESGVFDETSLETAALFAEQAWIVLANAEALTRAQSRAINLGEALTSRAMIDMAKGIAMAREGGTPDQAFDRLRQLSQSQHRKLREMAEELVDEASLGTGHETGSPDTAAAGERPGRAT